MIITGNLALPKTKLHIQAETPDIPTVERLAKMDTTHPIYTSSARAVSKKQRYRIYPDRIELDFKILFTKTFVIPAGEIIDI